MPQERRRYPQPTEPTLPSPPSDRPEQFLDNARRPRLPAPVRHPDQRRERGSSRYSCRPHSVFPVPAQRPLRGSAPGAICRVQVAQPMDG